MGRKDLTEQRTAEILDAFARSLLKFGLDASLDQVAQEAGMTRSIIRHYIGNREAVVNRLMVSIAQGFEQELEEITSKANQEDTISKLLDYLFSDAETFDDYDKLVMNVLMTAKDRYPQAKAALRGMLQKLIDTLADELKRAHPEAASKQCDNIAYSIVAMALSSESFVWLGLDHAYYSVARQSAETLIQTLTQ